MNSPIQQYLTTLANRLKAGTATEHSYRGDLQILIEALAPGVIATNEPKRQACGAPDYILTRNDIPVGYIEAKDIVGVNLDKTEKSDQLKRYRNSLENLLLTDYLDFRYFRDGEKVTSVSLAKVEGNSVVPQPENWPHFENLIKDFSQHVSQTIKSAPKLAEMMAGKARLMQTVLENALTADVKAIENAKENDEKTAEESELYKQFQAFKEVLLHDIKPAEFADIYAQTIAYGMFAARLHDPTLPTFSRMEAAQLIPQTNPFLRKLFQYIAGYDLDQRLAWIVDALADVFRASDVNAILKNFGKKYSSPSGGGQVGADPIIHFYETFLSAYNPALRKSRGVWYTPEPVVNFIVRAVDDILKTEFNLKDGLASTETTEIDVDVQHKKTKGKQTVHKVQVLDPATGTGTFLAEVIKHVHQQFEGQEGIWSQYVEKHLLPRLNGFEILMASYAMCHLKLDLLLNETGYKPQNPRRFKVYLTNSLEEAAPSQLSLFASWLSDEAMQANAVKRETPVMVVLGNPPYSGESQNKGKWIMDLMEDYKKEPGGKEKLKEKNPKWINDDYVKFLRFGQHFIEKNGEGILAFINPHGFLDNPTFRGMRWNLLKTYDKIYTLDLHGNSKKKETAPDGSADVNVFDIMQGVSINLFVKTGKKKPNELGQVFHYDLLGKRELKYDFLNENSLRSISFNHVNNLSPNYFFLQKDFGVQEEYEEGFSFVDLFPINSVGIVTARDSFTIHSNKEKVKNTIQEFLTLDNEAARTKFNLGKDARDWTIGFAKKDLINSGPDFSRLIEISYRPFDNKFTYYTGKSKGFHCMPRGEVMKHFSLGENLGLIIGRQGQVVGSMQWNLVFATKNISDFNLYYRGGGVVFPLYLYPESNAQTQLSGLEAARTPNFDSKTLGKIAEKLGLTFVPEKTSPTPPKEGLTKPGYVTANPVNYKLIKEMRDKLKANPTEAENILWEYLRNKKTGFKIRRQHIIHDFITDFVCLKKKVVIEIDGKIHLQQKEYDALRTRKLEESGYEVIRFTNEEVYKNPGKIASAIKAKLENKPDLQSDEDPSTASSPPSEGLGEVFSPLDLLDYIYAVLHSPAYRERYKEFLKIDFPRVPYPQNAEQFFQLAELGAELRQLHLLEHPAVNKPITQYPISGNNVVEKPRFEINYEILKGNTVSLIDPVYEMGRVYINETQFFQMVPKAAWEFYIGGYQPAQKWLKDRKGRELQFDDILHYQKIIVALKRTSEIMPEIDKVLNLETVRVEG